MKALRAGNYHAAEKNFVALLQQRPQWGLIHLQLGQLRLEMDAIPNQALVYLRRAAKLSPDNPRAHHQLGVAHQLSGDCKRALVSFDKAISLRAAYASSHFAKARCLEESHHDLKAVMSLQRVVALKRSHEGALASLARILERLGRISEAENALVKLTTLRPNALAYHVALGHFYQRQGKLAAAQKSFGKANDLKPMGHRKMRPLPKSSDAP